MAFKGCGDIIESPFSCEQIRVVLSQAISDLKQISLVGRVRDPVREKIRMERFRVLTDLCLSYTLIQIYCEIVDIRSEFNSYYMEDE